MLLSYSDARDYILYHPEVILTKAAKSGYICPCCGSGSGKHGTGMVQSKRSAVPRFTCFAKGQGDDCPQSSNVIDIVQKQHKTTAKEAFKICCDLYGIEIAKDKDKEQEDHKAVAETQKLRINHLHHAEEAPAVPREVIQADLEAAAKNIGKCPYLTARGLSLETQKAFKCGFLPNWYNPMVRQKIADGIWHFRGTPRMIIPTGKNSYLARDTRDNISEYEQKFTKQKVGTDHQFNWKALLNAKAPVFIVEGEIDAMSIYEAGHKEVAGLGSVAYANAMFHYIDEHPKETSKLEIIAVLDGDAPGRKATERLAEECKKRHIPFADGVSILLDGTKDPNESLCKDRNKFCSNIANEVRMAKKSFAKERAETR